MADEIVSPDQQVQLVVDERDMRTSFANGYRIHLANEEVVLDFGFNMLNPNPNPQSTQQQMLFKAGERVVMGYPTVKRLSISLAQIIRRYEEQMGQIQIQAGQPQRK